MARLAATDTVMDACVKMSDGNPGALTFCMALLNELPMGLLHMDTIGLYGSQLYMLWNDCCGRDMGEVKKVIQNYCAGILTAQEIRDNVSQPYGNPFPNLKTVEELFPSLAKA